MANQYSLSIAGEDSLHKGIHRATVMHESVELVFSKNDQIIKQTNLAADRTSIYLSLIHI